MQAPDLNQKPPGPPDGKPPIVVKEEMSDLKVELLRTPKELSKEIVDEGLESKTFRKGVKSNKVKAVAWEVAVPLEKKDSDENESTYVATIISDMKF